MIDALKEVNLGVVEDPKPTYVSASLTGDEERKYIELLKEFKDQAQRRFRPEPVPLIKTEVNKLIEVGFVSEVKYPTRISSIVHVRKKNGQIRVCVDFSDLNNACPKDEFPLPICELMIDATTGYEAMSFMDSSSGYNQIRMALKDEKLTAFHVYTATRLVGELLAQGNNEGKENALYYLSRMMTPNDIKYSPIEKLCLALVISIQKLKHYFQAHIVRLVSRANPIKFIMSKPVLHFLAGHPIPDDLELSDELPDEDAMVIEIQPPWKMYFDGAAHREGAGVGLVFITSQGEVFPYSFTLTQWCSNNVVEYQTLILGLEMAVDIKQLQLQVFGDSKLVINHILGSYKVKKPELVPYHKYAQILENKRADALAALASTLPLPDQTQVIICQRWVVPPPNDYEEEESEVEHLASVLEVEIEDWRQPLIDYLCYGILPKNP
ncbi:uncharacterized protein LOC142168356 [Nicotiana tabacum]|uniref:Uncharacterized protein LOC142168356 n=1 Tax=Nicotiana tabacum TaxID=4097 RepID=A0AC58SJJ1_TOBAC